MLENKKIIVIYKSKYGSTKYYADWIAKNIDADLLEVSEAKIEKLEKENENLLKKKDECTRDADWESLWKAGI